MKSIFIKLFILTLAFLIAIPFMFACGDDTQPVQGSSSQTSSSEKNDEAKDPVDGFDALSQEDKAFYILGIDIDEEIYRTDSSFTFSTSLLGSKIEAEASGFSIISFKDDILSEYQEMRLSIAMAGTSSVQKEISGYIDGRDFQKTSQDGVVLDAVYSEISQEDYLTKKEEDSVFNDDFDLTAENCGSATFKKTKTGNYVATFTDITGDGLEPFNEMVEGAFDTLVSNELADVTLTLTVTPEFIPVSIAIDFEFEGNNPPTLSLNSAYTFDDELFIPEIDWSEYSEKITPDNFEKLSEAQQAFHLLRAEVDEDTVTVDTTMSFSMYIDNRQLAMEIKQKSMITNANGNYEEYTVAEIEASYAGRKQSSVVIQGYLDGKLFAQISENGYITSAVAKPMSMSEYLAQKAQQEQGLPEYFGISETTCGSATCTKENGTYRAIFAQLGDESLNYFHEMASQYLSQLKSRTLLDVIVSIYADEQLKTTKMIASYTYSRNNSAQIPTVRIESDYTYGVAEIPEMDWSGFQIEDDTTNPPVDEL